MDICEPHGKYLSCIVGRVYRAFASNGRSAATENTALVLLALCVLRALPSNGSMRHNTIDECNVTSEMPLENSKTQFTIRISMNFFQK
jgi:hypothetical protein